MLDIDAEDTLEAIVVGLAVLGAAELLTGFGGSSTPTDDPRMLDERTLQHLEDGGTVEVGRWHGDTLELAATSTGNGEDSTDP